MADLPDLIGFCLGAFRLQVQNFLDVLLRENVMAALDPLFEPQAQQ